MEKEIKSAGIWFKSFVMISFITLLFSCSGQKHMIDKSVANELELPKYLGTWYEIARYDHPFERGLVGVTANYSMRPDGKIKVLNSGYKNSLGGEYTETLGKAKIPDPENEQAKFKVAFFWIFYADYYVLELDENYQWALIGSKSDKYLWILSRTPQLEPNVYNYLLHRIEQRGYDTSALIKVEQKVE
ncbi:MAG TPA: lipocalin family protein [Draconibacterium sp.]|nr:lipocalin family protein [Draconibacterium sp.]